MLRYRPFLVGVTSLLAARQSRRFIARCESHVSSIPSAPTTAPLKKKAAEIFNTTPAAVMKDLEKETFLPADVDLHSKEWKCQIYQFDSCPFCRKARACLDYLQIPYEVVETHPLSKKELKEVTDYKKVPVFVVTETNPAGTGRRFVLTDSKRIVHGLMAHEGKASSDNPERKAMELAWIKWSDDVLVQLIVVNIYRSLKESAETFQYLMTHPSYSVFEKYTGKLSGTLVMWLVSKRRKSKYEIVDERKALYDALDEFMDAKGAAEFHGGALPNEADFNVYGILRSIRGFSCEKDVLAHSKISPWMNKMDTLTHNTANTR